VNDKSGNFRTEDNQVPSHFSPESSCLDVFLSEIGRFKRVAAGMGLGASDCEDVLQDVSVQALRHLERFDSRERIVRWLMKVTVNRCLVEHRRRRTFRRRVAETLGRRASAGKAMPGPDARVMAAEQLEIMRQALRGLDGSLLAPVVLRYFCGLDSAEVGEVLGLKASTVRSRLREARMALAGKLIQRGVVP
jgi:RNA polymerase sigma-70 factor (ECF subfamily)